MYCSKCGKPNADNARFCASCGAPMAATQPAQPMAAQPVMAQTTEEAQPVMMQPMEASQAAAQPMAAVQTPPAVPKKKKGFKVLIAILVLLLLVAVGVVAFVLFSRAAQNKKISEQFALAEQYLDELEYEEAVAAYLAVLDLDEKNEEAADGLMDAYIKWAESYAESNDYEKALEILQNADERASSRDLKKKTEQIETQKEDYAEQQRLEQERLEEEKKLLEAEEARQEAEKVEQSSQNGVLFSGDAINTYNAYLGLQTPAFSFRNSFDDATFGRNTEYFNQITGWDSSCNTITREGTFTDAVISGNGTYTVSVSGMDLKGDFDAQDHFNLIFLSTDIPNTGEITISDMKLKVDGRDVSINPVLSPDSVNYVIMMIENIWDDDVTIGYYSVPPTEMSVTFTVSGFAYDNTAAP